MILTTKNKNLQGMQLLLDQNEKVAGIPDKFLLDKREFGLFLLELQAARKYKMEVPVAITDKIMDNVYHSTALRIYKQPFTNKSINSIIRRWIKGEFTITFRDVPIKYQSPKTKEKENAQKWQG